MGFQSAGARKLKLRKSLRRKSRTGTDSMADHCQGANVIAGSATMTNFATR